MGGPFRKAPATDHVDRLFERFGSRRPGMAPNMPVREAPAQACRRKMPAPATTFPA